MVCQDDGGLCREHTGRKLWSLTESHGALASSESAELCLNVTNKSVQSEQVGNLVEVA